MEELHRRPVWHIRIAYENTNTQIYSMRLSCKRFNDQVLSFVPFLTVLSFTFSRRHAGNWNCLGDGEGRSAAFWKLFSFQRNKWNVKFFKKRLKTGIFHLLFLHCLILTISSSRLFKGASDPSAAGLVVAFPAGRSLRCLARCVHLNLYISIWLASSVPFFCSPVFLFHPFFVSSSLYAAVWLCCLWLLRLFICLHSDRSVADAVATKSFIM